MQQYKWYFKVWSDDWAKNTNKLGGDFIAVGWEGKRQAIISFICIMDGPRPRPISTPPQANHKSAYFAPQAHARRQAAGAGQLVAWMLSFISIVQVRSSQQPGAELKKSISHCKTKEIRFLIPKASHCIICSHSCPSRQPAQPYLEDLAVLHWTRLSASDRPQY